MYSNIRTVIVLPVMQEVLYAFFNSQSYLLSTRYYLFSTRNVDFFHL